MNNFWLAVLALIIFFIAYIGWVTWYTEREIEQELNEKDHNEDTHKNDIVQK